ncbi:hypothetical protein [Chenggangzhangella methanolivorans]|uniref:Uncharacterized protein n=1 Tax=Chenggangzhangella methanolivorans TaxID=1437009 RepID=A0A9E6UNR6_9HYPH|nr:hypothetical protein [Chenggangzhangella methanolivorans]QZN98864.1 hypothetical protein K6K41_18325 [Chenggangzhangella methanolivorans]
MMGSRTNPNQSVLRALIVALSALAAAAAFGAVVASALSIGGSRIKPSLQNPFESSRSSQ